MRGKERLRKRWQWAFVGEGSRPLESEKRLIPNNNEIKEKEQEEMAFRVQIHSFIS